MRRVLLLLLLLAAPTAAAEDEVATHVRRLGSMNASLRQSAAWSLRRMGPAAAAAVPALARAARQDPATGVRIEAAAALAAIGTPEARQALARVERWLLSVLEARLSSSVVLERRHALQRIGDLGRMASSLAPGVRRCLASDADSTVRQAAIRALVETTGPAAAPDLERLLAGTDKRLWTWAAMGLGRLAPQTLPSLRIGLTDADADRRAACAIGLEAAGPAAAEAEPDLIKALEDRDYRVRRAAASALGRLRAAAAVAALARLAGGDPDLRVARAAGDALGQIDDETARLAHARYVQAISGRFMAGLKDPEPTKRAAAIRALVELSPSAPGLVDALVAALGDTSEWVRQAAADGLGTLDARGTVGPLEKALGDQSILVRSAALASLERMYPESLPALARAFKQGNFLVSAAAKKALERIGTPEARAVLGGQ